MLLRVCRLYFRNLHWRNGTSDRLIRMNTCSYFSKFRLPSIHRQSWTGNHRTPRPEECHTGGWCGARLWDEFMQSLWGGSLLSSLKLLWHLKNWCLEESTFLFRMPSCQMPYWFQGSLGGFGGGDLVERAIATKLDCGDAVWSYEGVGKPSTITPPKTNITIEKTHFQ